MTSGNLGLGEPSRTDREQSFDSTTTIVDWSEPLTLSQQVEAEQQNLEIWTCAIKMNAGKGRVSLRNGQFTVRTLAVSEGMEGYTIGAAEFDSAGNAWMKLLPARTNMPGWVLQVALKPGCKLRPVQVIDAGEAGLNALQKAVVGTPFEATVRLLWETILKTKDHLAKLGADRYSLDNPLPNFVVRFFAGKSLISSQTIYN
jgi:hypothetical protein